jgi:RimJ/RimL family protein N-acetyltransferase
MDIKGEKVTLRAIESKDCDVLRKMINDAETEYMIGGWSFPVSSREQQRWFENLPASDNNTLRVMIDTDEGTVGTAILSNIDYKNGTAEIHVKLLKGNYRNKGYGSDTVNALINYAFEELRMNCVFAQVSNHNVPSRKMFEKCGFIKEGVMRQRIFKHGEYLDVVIYSVIRTNR